MNKLPLLALVSACLLAITVIGSTTAKSATTTATSVAGGVTLDLPSAIIRIKTGAHIQEYRVDGSGRTISVDGHTAKTWEGSSNGVSVNSTVSPSVEYGDEYIFLVRRPGQKAKAYSMVFKGGYLLIAADGEVKLEVEDMAGGINQ